MRTKKITRKRSLAWVAVSGGFDPLHIGHTRLFKEARALGDRLVVILNNDNWLRMKKKYVFMPEKERVELLRAFPFVDKVVLTSHARVDKDMSVCGELLRIKPAIFANGGDRKYTTDIPEAALCEKLGIAMIFNVGRGGKVQSSSWMIEAASRAIARLTKVSNNEKRKSRR